MTSNTLTASEGESQLFAPGMFWFRVCGGSFSGSHMVLVVCCYEKVFCFCRFFAISRLSGDKFQAPSILAAKFSDAVCYELLESAMNVSQSSAVAFRQFISCSPARPVRWKRTIPQRRHLWFHIRQILVQVQANPEETIADLKAKVAQAPRGFSGDWKSEFEII